MEKLKTEVYNEHYLYEEEAIVVGVIKRCYYVCRHCGKKSKYPYEQSWGYVHNMGGDTDMMAPCECINKKECVKMTKVIRPVFKDEFVECFKCGVALKPDMYPHEWEGKEVVCIQCDDMEKCMGEMEVNDQNEQMVADAREYVANSGGRVVMDNIYAKSNVVSAKELKEWMDVKKPEGEMTFNDWVKKFRVDALTLEMAELKEHDHKGKFKEKMGILIKWREECGLEAFDEEKKARILSMIDRGVKRSNVDDDEYDEYKKIFNNIMDSREEEVVKKIERVKGCDNFCCSECHVEFEVDTDFDGQWAAFEKHVAEEHGDAEVDPIFNKFKDSHTGLRFDDGIERRM